MQILPWRGNTLNHYFPLKFFFVCESLFLTGFGFIEKAHSECRTKGLLLVVVAVFGENKKMMAWDSVLRKHNSSQCNLLSINTTLGTVLFVPKVHKSHTL